MALKIGFLTERLLLGYGVDLVVHEYASFLVKDGHSVTVFCQKLDSSVLRSYKVIDLSQQEAVTMTSSMSRNIINFAAYFNDCDIDVWIVNTPPFYDAIPLLHSPVVAVEYGTPPAHFFAPEIGRNLRASVAYRFKHVFPKLRSEDKILCISRSIQRWLPDKSRALSEVVYLGCDHYPKATTEEARQFREDLKFESDTVVVLWVGRVQVRTDEQPYKRFSEFLEIAERARLMQPKLRFVVVGRGGDEEATLLRERHIEPCLNLAANRMGAAFAGSDIFVSTSHWEGLNLPLLEAQYQGTPAIAYRHGPHTEVVRDNETGILVDDAEGLLKAILSLANDENERRRLASRAHAFAAGFSWERSAVELRAALMRALDRAEQRGATKRPAIDLSGSGLGVFVLRDTYNRHGFVFLLKRAILSLRFRLSRVLRRMGGGL
ncbi:glycosyltransferase family 4 protein [Rhizobium sp. NXC24]|uniref:glycosyltransferase family 4 protein n=1 Tax=Rhizobium sp. NXC24 TaxID=2048897 RepID=UPI000CDF55A7|nr:glycosyltransferase family 4 protein [Rhizobium sp. NXC24]AVA25733.1 glycosyltransferase family 1 protein [Rhizobium sp. NXC24]